MLGVGAVHLTYNEKRLDRESSKFFKGQKTSKTLFYIKKLDDASFVSPITVMVGKSSNGFFKKKIIFKLF